MKLFILGLLIVLAISFFSIRPMLSSGYFPMHDNTQIARVVVMGKALQYGQFPVRWVTDLGYGFGYPIYNFYGPLPYYVGGVFFALGAPAILATKLMFIFGAVLAGISMYIVAYRFYGLKGGLLASVFYVLAPYHAVQMYVRGSVGEYWALIFLPLLFYPFNQPASTRSKIFVAAFGLAGAILSHTIVGFLAVIFMILILAISTAISFFDRKFMVIRRIFFWSLLLGLGISAFFWLPAFSEMTYTAVASQIGPSANYRDHFVCLSQLWDSPWGFGGSAPGCIDGMSFKLGKLHMLLAFTSLCMAFLIGKWKMNTTSINFAASLVFCFSIFCMLSVSEPLWGSLSYLAYVQYPWRLLSWAGVSMAFLIGGLASYYQGRFSSLLFGGVIALCLLINLKLFSPQYLYPLNGADVTSQKALRFEASRISDEYLPADLERPSQESEYVRNIVSPTDGLEIIEQTNSDIHRKINLSASSVTHFTLNQAFFPGWHYYLDGQEIHPQIQKSLPLIELEEGSHILEMWFRDTPVRLIGNILSLGSIVGILFYLYGTKTNA